MANIYVVEDEIDIAMLLKSILENDGHDVTLFSNGEEALAAIRQTLPDLIVLDVMLPRVDGYTFCGKLQEDSRTRELPVVVTTAKGKMRETFKSFPNVTAFLDKPFNHIVLTGMVERALKKRAE